MKWNDSRPRNALGVLMPSLHKSDDRPFKVFSRKTFCSFSLCPSLSFPVIIIFEFLCVYFGCEEEKFIRCCSIRFYLPLSFDFISFRCRIGWAHRRRYGERRPAGEGVTKDNGNALPVHWITYYAYINQPLDDKKLYESSAPSPPKWIITAENGTSPSEFGRCQPCAGGLPRPILLFYF